MMLELFEVDDVKAAFESLPKPNLGLLAAFALVFGFQRLVPSYAESYKDWYPNLRKPSWTPPGWVFPCVWIPLKILQSGAIWIVWELCTNKEDLILPLVVFIVHLSLGNWWNVVFFGRHQLDQSLLWMGAFLCSISGCITLFAPIHILAGALMIPTQIWVVIAAKLNFDIVSLNTKQSAKQA